mmetsp:Transcript_12747/g.42560  ORF Transcript_12747/g.42560 Transcript_12747/m.42560 type:complete len:210 (-) Transcript_12747:33-662(-)
MGNSSSNESAAGAGKADASDYFNSSGSGFVKLLLTMGCITGGLDDDDSDDDGDIVGGPLDPPHPLDGVAATYAQANDVDFHRTQQENQMKRSELVFLREFKTMMIAGFKLIKHDVYGTAVTQTLRLTSDHKTIAWGPTEAGDEHTVPLYQIVAVSRGGLDLVPPDVDDRCLVLDCDDNAHVFETVDRETRELIADGFELLLEPAPTSNY